MHVYQHFRGYHIVNWTNGQKYPLCIYCEIKFYAVKFLIIEKYILLYLSICPVISKRPKFLSNCCPALDVPSYNSVNHCTMSPPLLSVLSCVPTGVRGVFKKLGLDFTHLFVLYWRHDIKRKEPCRNDTTPRPLSDNRRSSECG